MINVPIKTTMFGIKTIKINGTQVFTFKVAVNSNPFNQKQFSVLNCDIFDDGRKITATYTTTNQQHFNAHKDALLYALRNIAMHNVTTKYNNLQGIQTSLDLPEVIVMPSLHVNNEL